MKLRKSRQSISSSVLAAIMLITTVIFIAGCGSSGGDSKTSTTTKNAYIGGTNGMTMKFVEGSPPAEVYDKGTYPFDVSVKLENKGEYKVAKNKIKVKILGIDPVEFSSPVMQKNPDEDMDSTHLGPEGETISGTVSYMTFSNFNYKGTAGSRQQFPLWADICYEYGGEAQSMICVRENMLGTTDTVCKVNEVKKSESSSSPVQISQFQENAAGKDKLTFSFVVEHKGTGAIYALDKECDETPVNKNKVFLKVDVKDMTGLTCTGLEGGGASEGYVRLEDGKRTVRCTLSTAGAKGDFDKSVKVFATFKYKEHIEQTLLVKPSTS